MGKTEDWLLKKPAGMMFLAKFLKENWRRLVATRTGDEICRQIASEVPKAPVVIEITSDGGIRVFADRASVKIVKPLDVTSLRETTSRMNAEVIAEDLCSLSLRGEHKEIYLDQRKLCATEHFSHMSAKTFSKMQDEVRFIRDLDDLAVNKRQEAIADGQQICD